MKGKALRKLSLHNKTAVSVLLKPFISGEIYFGEIKHNVMNKYDL